MSAPVDPHLYLAFLGVMAVLAMTPGPAILFAVATGVERGRRAALVGVAGMNAAMLVWFGAAALGLGAVIAAHPGLFGALTLAGAAYVAWLGVRSLAGALAARAGDNRLEAAVAAPAGGGARSAFRGGFAVQIANPKVLIFFAAVLPPFLDPARPLAPQLALFALGTLSLDVLFMSAYGLGGAVLAARMAQPRFRRAFSAGVGLLLLTVAALILLRA